jgi:hypothetical protein
VPILPAMSDGTSRVRKPMLVVAGLIALALTVFVGASRISDTSLWVTCWTVVALVWVSFFALAPELKARAWIVLPVGLSAWVVGVTIWMTSSLK